MYNILLLVLVSIIFSQQLSESQISILKEYNSSNIITEYNVLNNLVGETFETAESHYIIYKFCLQTDDLGCANSHINKAISLDKKNENYRESSFTLEAYLDKLNRAKKTLDMGYYDEAISEYDDIISLYPDRALLYYELGLVYKLKQDNNTAIKYFIRAKSIIPYKQ